MDRVKYAHDGQTFNPPYKSLRYPRPRYYLLGIPMEWDTLAKQQWMLVKPLDEPGTYFRRSACACALASKLGKEPNMFAALAVVAVSGASLFECGKTLHCTLDAAIVACGETGNVGGHPFQGEAPNFHGLREVMEQHTLKCPTMMKMWADENGVKPEANGSDLTVEIQ